MRGKRVILREVEDGDIEVMTRWRNNPAINKYFFTHEPTTVDQQRHWIASLREKADEKLFIIATADSAESKPVGTVGFVHIDKHNRSAEWGRFMIGEASLRGRGFASEALYLSLVYAFRELNLERLYLEVFSWNEEARSLYEKFGFKLEGTLRSHVYSDGRFHDVALYGLLRSEFLENENEIRKALYEIEGQ